MRCTVDQQGRVAIPEPIRDELQLNPGRVLEILEEDGKVYLRPVEETGLIRKDGVLIYTGLANGDLTHAVDEQRRERAKDLGGYRR